MAVKDPFEIESGIPRKVLPLIFVLDTSGSMSGAPIGALNTAMRQALAEVGTISRNNADAQIKIGVLEFSSDARWMYPQLKDSEDFQYQDLSASGLTELDRACAELNSKLTRQAGGFMVQPTGTKAPAIILITDGDPTGSFPSQMEKLKENKWFKHACKLALLVGDDPSDEAAAKFTGSKEAVFRVNDLKSMIDAIKVMSMVMSNTMSKSSDVKVGDKPGNESTNQENVVEELKNTFSDSDTNITPGDVKSDDFWGGW